jgi:hypothetical protein
MPSEAMKPVQNVTVPTIENFEDFLKGNEHGTLSLNYEKNADPVLRNLYKATKTIKPQQHNVEALQVYFSVGLTVDGLSALSKFVKNSKLTDLALFRFEESYCDVFLKSFVSMPNQDLRKLTLELPLTGTNSKQMVARNLSRAFPKLNTLTLSAYLTDNDLASMNLSHLTNLDLKGNYLEGIVLSLTYCIPRHLKTLNLESNAINGKSLVYLGDFTNLTDLNLRCNKLEDQDAQKLSQTLVNLKDLRDLDLSKNPSIGNDGILSLVKNLTQLSKLSVSSNSMNAEGGKLLASTLGKKTGGLILNIDRNKMTPEARDAVMQDLRTSETDATVTVYSNLIYSKK